MNTQAPLPSRQPRRHRDSPIRRSGPVRRSAGPPPLVVTADVSLLDHILAASAAAGVEPTVVADAPGLRPLWVAAPLVVVGVDLARRAAELVLPRRTEVYLAGAGSEPDELWHWSAALGAAVVALPAGASQLTAAFCDVTGAPGGSGRLVAVIGGSGGVGASTTAAALAATAAADGATAMLVDLDPLGGGLDLLVGAEAVPGWRWPRLSTAQGHLGDLTGHLPRVAGIDVLSIARAEEPVPAPGPEAVRAVLMSAVRSHRSVIVDLPRRLDPVADEALRRADHALLLSGDDVRATAAAQQTALELRNLTADLGLLVRRSRSGGVAPRFVAEAVGLDLVAVIGNDPSLRSSAERGDPPGRAARTPLARAARAILAALSGQDRAA